MLYCYYFRTDGSVEKQKIKCRKNKTCYAYKEIGYRCDFTVHIPFSDIGKIISPDLEQDDHHGCRIYLESDIEITEEMIGFAQKRAEKIKELQKVREEYYKELKNLCYDFGFKN